MTTPAVVARWWNWHSFRERREMLGVDQRSVDTLNFRFLPQEDMRDVFLIYARMQRPRSQW